MHFISVCLFSFSIFLLSSEYSCPIDGVPSFPSRVGGQCLFAWCLVFSFLFWYLLSTLKFFLVIFACPFILGRLHQRLVEAHYVGMGLPNGALLMMVGLCCSFRRCSKIQCIWSFFWFLAAGCMPRSQHSGSLLGKEDWLGLKAWQLHFILFLSGVSPPSCAVPGLCWELPGSAPEGKTPGSCWGGVGVAQAVWGRDFTALQTYPFSFSQLFHLPPPSVMPGPSIPKLFLGVCSMNGFVSC